MSLAERQYLKLSEISTDGGTQARAQTDWLVVDEYAHAMQDGATFPPVVVFWDGSDYWLADGFHRIEAAARAGLETLPADVRQGTRRDAVLYACGANSAHGLRRTNADKRRAVETLLQDEEWRRWNDSEIGRRCRVDPETVTSRRLALYPPKSEDTKPKLVTRNGVTYEMNTANIGQRNGGAPVVEDEPEPLPFTDSPTDKAIDWEFLGDVPEDGPRMVYIEDEYGDEKVWLEPDEELRVVKKMDVHFSSATPEHYTPQYVLDRVIACMGGIDLDPCSNSHDAPNVPAATHYTPDDDGLRQEWAGTVYMNPPYGREIDAWVTKLVDAYERGRVTEAIALVPARTDTQWWQRLNAYHVCFVVGRLTFIGNSDPAPFPSAIVYLGSEVDAFVNAFEDMGPIWHMTRRGYCFGE